MLFEPILLEAALRAVFGWIVEALRAGIMRDKLLIKLLAVLVLRIEPILLLFPYVLQGALIVLALAHMDELVTRRLGRHERLLLLNMHLLFGHTHLLHLHLVLCIPDATRLHHARLVHEAALA